MKLTLSTIVFSALVMLAACGSIDDGTQYVQEIEGVSQEGIESGRYGGKYKVELKDRDGITTWIYTDIEFIVGDSLSLIPMSQAGLLSNLQTSNVELTATIEQDVIQVAIQDSIINALRSELSTKTGQLAEALNFKTQVKSLIAEVESPVATIQITKKKE